MFKKGIMCIERQKEWVSVCKNGVWIVSVCKRENERGRDRLWKSEREMDCVCKIERDRGTMCECV